MSRQLFPVKPKRRRSVKQNEARGGFIHTGFLLICFVVFLTWAAFKGDIIVSEFLSRFIHPAFLALQKPYSEQSQWFRVAPFSPPSIIWAQPGSLLWLLARRIKAFWALSPLRVGEPHEVIGVRKFPLFCRIYIVFSLLALFLCFSHSRCLGSVMVYKFSDRTNFFWYRSWHDYSGGGCSFARRIHV